MAVLTNASIKYQAETKLVDLLVEVAEASSIRKVKSKMHQATKIRYFLKALNDAEDQFLDAEDLTVLYQCLQDTAEITSYPTAPNLNAVSIPAILIGTAGTNGTDGADANILTTEITLTGMGAGTTTVDSFSDLSPITAEEIQGVVWFYTLEYPSANATKAGMLIGACDTTTPTAGTTILDMSTGRTQAVSITESFAFNATGTAVRLDYTHNLGSNVNIYLTRIIMGGRK